MAAALNTSNFVLRDLAKFSIALADRDPPILLREEPEKDSPILRSR